MTIMFEKIFKDRIEAGRFLADRLTDYAARRDVIVLGLPRGGIPVAYEVAQKLRAQLDVFTVRKLSVPGHEELAMGAIASGGVRVLNHDVLSYIRIPDEEIDRVAADELRELERRERLYRGARPPVDVRDRVVIVVDDGLATGSTVRAAVKALRQKGPKQIVVAAPVGARETCDSFKDEVDVVCVCALTPEPFQAVGLWYENFEQTTDDEVRKLLTRAMPGDQRKAAA